MSDFFEIKKYIIIKFITHFNLNMMKYSGKICIINITSNTFAIQFMATFGHYTGSINDLNFVCFYPNLSQATLYISSSISMPINSRFIDLQETPVLPEPIVGSKTVSPSLL